MTLGGKLWALFARPGSLLAGILSEAGAYVGTKTRIVPRGTSVVFGSSSISIIAGVPRGTMEAL
jgi:hypothetical protein